MNTLTDAVKGTHCAYALRLQGDAHATEYHYVGSTSDIQTRIAQHTGAIPGGAKWTALHPPVSVLDVVPCATAFQAACVECALWGLYAGKCKDYDRVRGAKFCMLEPLRFAPTGWKTRPQTLKRSIEEVDEDLHLLGPHAALLLHKGDRARPLRHGGLEGRAATLHLDQR